MGSALPGQVTSEARYIVRYQAGVAGTACCREKPAKHVVTRSGRSVFCMTSKGSHKEGRSGLIAAKNRIFP